MRHFPDPEPAEEFLRNRQISTDYLDSKRYKFIEVFARHPENAMLMSADKAISDITNTRYLMAGSTSLE